MGGRIACANHLDSVARFHCSSCDKHLCESCSKHVWAPNGFVDQCVGCHGLLQPIDAGPVVRADAGPAAFMAELPEMLRYPLQRPVLLTLIGLAVLMTPLYWAVANNINPLLSLFGLILILGFEISTYFHIINQTSAGHLEFEPPEAAHIADLLGFVFRYLVALSPIAIGVLWYGHAQYGSFWLGFLVLADPGALFEMPSAGLLVGIGLLLMPLTTAIAALDSSLVAVINPMLWVHSLRVLMPTYAIAAAAFYGVLGVQYLLLPPAQEWVRNAADIPFVTSVVLLTINYGLLAIRARMIGALCAPHLGGFDEH